MSCILWTNLALAHEIRPAIVTVAFTADNRYEITIVANIEALLAEIGPTHIDTNESPSADLYNQPRVLAPQELRARVDAFAARWLAGSVARWLGGSVEFTSSSTASRYNPRSRQSRFRLPAIWRSPVSAP